MKQPRMMTYAELWAKIFPFVRGYKWGADTVWDLWKSGRVVPQDRCPGGKPCPEYPNCKHVRHILLPAQLEKWWGDVAERISVDISASTIFK
jgi:hypothetical protein